MMKRLSLVGAIAGVVVAWAAIGASAQPLLNLTGTYVCVQMCRGGNEGFPAYVTQNGDSINLVTETGDSFHATPDWSAPSSRIWIDARDESAVYSPDGMRFQFDDGRVWQRDMGSPVMVRRAPVVWQRKMNKKPRQFGGAFCSAVS
jgi:hypothetical protein